MEEQAVTGTAASRYSQLTGEREHFVDRGDKCAKLTLPTLFKKDVTSALNMKIVDPAQTAGANGVNTLGSKMVMSMIPMNTPFFKLNLDEINPDMDKDLVKEVMKGLGVIERQTLRDIENSGDVTVVFEGIKHLIVVGNVLMYVGMKGTRVYSLNKYVVVRDPDGEWREVVVCEDVSPLSLKKELQEKLAEEGKLPAGNSADKHLKMYTHVKREDGRVKWHQEVCGHIIEGSESDVPEDGNPWMPLRFIRVDGENYGRSYVEMFLGDLESLETLTKAVNEGSAAAAKVIFLVRPNGTTNPKVIANAKNLSVRTGDANDVTVLRLDKQADMSVAKDMIATITRQLAYAFMQNAQVMRDAERVTAEEVRYVAQELDNSLGGIYSLLSKEFQLPYVKRRLFMLRKTKNVPKLPNGVQPAIVTGFAALGKGHDSDKLMRFLEKCAQAAQVAKSLGGTLNINELILRFALADGIEVEGLFISEEDQTTGKQTEQGMELINKLGPEMLKQAGPLLQQQIMGEQGEVPAETPQTAQAG
ncbi:portal protein [Pseudovibrio ascidiaceicola]|uniref:portal protein n=1 Tax=Pseudovibrio ascidiaceicola TaxID=285279 RepID=UPI003D35E2DF